MEIEEMEATMTPPLPQVEQPSNQLSQLLLSPYAEIEFATPPFFSRNKIIK